ncbi:coproporphyrinogen III oxidase family protein [bacterium]|nr:coproporphyrinogen III oxidase family protein [bacterium]
MTGGAAPGAWGLYVHVPFCGSICSYCHFARTAEHGAELRARYVAAVRRELDLRREACGVLAAARRPLATCYLGGGTPSQLEPDLMTTLLADVLAGWPRTDDFELTAEANPETLTPDVVDAWLAAGVTRVSLGVQSLDAEVLRLLGRACDPTTARHALALACARFPRVSADWIIGPGLVRERLLAELDEAVALGVEHFSVYILEVHPGTRLERRLARGEVRLLPDAATERLYLAVIEHLAGHGIVQYEVANFARPGAESRHNRNYWRHRPWLALGPGAHGYWGRRRYANPDDLPTWLAALEAGRLPAGSIDELDRPALRLERLILALRTAEGVRIDGLPPGALDLARGEAEGLWRVRQGRLALTGTGFLRLDTIEERLAGLTLPDPLG